MTATLMTSQVMLSVLYVCFFPIKGYIYFFYFTYLALFCKFHIYSVYVCPFPSKCGKCLLRALLLFLLHLGKDLTCYNCKQTTNSELLTDEVVRLHTFINWLLQSDLKDPNHSPVKWTLRSLALGQSESLFYLVLPLN